MVAVMGPTAPCQWYYSTKCFNSAESNGKSYASFLSHNGAHVKHCFCISANLTSPLRRKWHSFAENLPAEEQLLSTLWSQRRSCNGLVASARSVLFRVRLEGELMPLKKGRWLLQCRLPASLMSFMHNWFVEECRSHPLLRCFHLALPVESLGHFGGMAPFLPPEGRKEAIHHKMDGPLIISPICVGTESFILWGWDIPGTADLAWALLVREVMYIGDGSLES